MIRHEWSEDSTYLASDECAGFWEASVCGSYRRGAALHMGDGAADHARSPSASRMFSATSSKAKPWAYTGREPGGQSQQLRPRFVFDDVTVREEAKP